MNFSDQQLMAYFDESLAGELMAAIEEQLRNNEQLRQRLVTVVSTRDAGVHALGEIWRRNRISCPTRQQMGNYLLGAIDSAAQEYIEFHLAEVGCRICQANLEDLRSQQSAAQGSSTQQRRRKYFQTSAGYLNKPNQSSQ